MVLGMFGILPLLKGWQYKDYVIGGILTRGGVSKDLSISERGFLLSAATITTDAHMHVRVEWHDSDLKLFTEELYAEGFDDLGGFASGGDASQTCQKYFRPNPLSTAGVYTFQLFGGGFYGSPAPYVSSFRFSVFLAPESTQLSAYASVQALAVTISNAKLFIQSLREVLGVKDKEIDPQILQAGVSSGGFGFGQNQGFGGSK